MLPFIAMLIYLFLTDRQDRPEIFDAEQVAPEGTFKSPWFEPLLWIGGLYAGSMIIGFIPSIIIFFVFFFSFKAKTSWLKTSVLTAVGVILLLAFSHFLNLELPQGLI